MQLTADGPVAVGSVLFRTDAALVGTLVRPRSLAKERLVAWGSAQNGVVATLVAKLWLRMGRGVLSILPPEEGLSAADRPFPEGQSRGVYAPADLSPLKLRPELLLVGSVQAPTGRPAASLDVRAALGTIDKRMLVHADRWLDGAGRLHPGNPFSSMPMVFERAAAGAWNPLGVRPAKDPSFVPNLVAPGRGPASIADIATMAPTCLAPIPWQWSMRQGAMVRQNIDLTSELPLLLSSHDLRSLNAGALDQQADELRGTEDLILENVFADMPMWSSQLPRVQVNAASTKGRSVEAAMTIDTVWVDATRGICTLTYRGYVPLTDAREDIAFKAALKNATDGPSSGPRSARKGGDKPRKPMTMMIGDLKRDDAAPSLPFPHLARNADGSVKEPVAKEAARPGLPFGDDPFKPEATKKSIFEVIPAASGPGSTLPLDTPRPKLQRRAQAEARPDETLDTPIDTDRTGAPAVVMDVPTRPVVISPQVVAPPPVVVPVSPMPAPGPAPLRVEAPKAYDVYTPVAVGLPAAAAAKAAPIEAPAELVRVVAFQPDIVSWIRANVSYRFILDAAQNAPLAPELDDPETELEDQEPAAEVEDRRDLEAVLGGAAPMTEAEVRATLREATSPPDDLAQERFSRPIVPLEGVLELPFDEIDVLRATLAVATSHGSDAPQVQEVLSTARAFLASPGVPSAGDVVMALVQRLRATFDRANVATVASFETATEPTLVERRSRVVRSVLGGKFIRGTIQLTQSGSLTTYLPMDMSDQLPSGRRIPVRLLARIHPALEELDPAGVQLEVVAVAERIPVRRDKARAGARAGS